MLGVLSGDPRRRRRHEGDIKLSCPRRQISRELVPKEFVLSIRKGDDDDDREQQCSLHARCSRQEFGELTSDISPK